MISIIFSSCTGLTKLPKDQQLVTKNTLKLTDKEKTQSAKQIKNKLSSELIPKPNSKFLWMRPGLSIYNTIKEPKKEKGFKYWLKYKLGQPPVFFNEETTKNMSQAIENNLYHIGHFKAQATIEIKKKKRTVQIQYLVQANKVYIIDTVIFPKPIDPITLAINQSREETLIKKGNTYTLETLIAERKRIDQVLKRLGYFYFDHNYLVFKADTSLNNFHVHLKLLLKNDNPREASQIYKINDIYLAEDFRLINYHPDTNNFGNYKLVSEKSFIRPEALLNHIFLYKDSLYSQSDHNNTLRQLLSINTYKYVNVKYIQSLDKKHKLDAEVMLSPHKKMSASVELNAVSKSNNFAGPGVKLSFKNRNFFRGAEIFSLNLKGRFEKQISGAEKGDLAYEVSLDAKLDIPRNVPIKTKKVSKPYVPTTSIILGTGFFTRVSLYRFFSINTGLVYTWRKNQFLTHKFQPIEISSTNLLDASEEFQEYLKYNPSIRQSFEEQFIVGMAYKFIFNHLNDSKKKQYYFSIGVDPSGNLVAMVNKLVTSGRNSQEDQTTLFGTPVSQYFRIRADGRYYFITGKKSKIAVKLIGGIGIPYGNSTVIPYVKQYFAGGTNSVRAFRARSLGPGSYHPPEDLSNLLIDQTGEIKIESSIEYRFPIIKYLNGALFVDAGNVWLTQEDSLRPGGRFNKETFYKEFGVGLGAGLRLDFDIVVVRFDLAFPVRKPWYPEGNRWVFNEINLSDNTWRKNNLLLNISIGYPF